MTSLEAVCIWGPHHKSGSRLLQEAKGPTPGGRCDARRSSQSLNNDRGCALSCLASRASVNGHLPLEVGKRGRSGGGGGQRGTETWAPVIRRGADVPVEGVLGAGRRRAADQADDVAAWISETHFKVWQRVGGVLPKYLERTPPRSAGRYRDGRCRALRHRCSLTGIVHHPSAWQLLCCLFQAALCLSP